MLFKTSDFENNRELVVNNPENNSLIMNFNHSSKTQDNNIKLFFSKHWLETALLGWIITFFLEEMKQVKY